MDEKTTAAWTQLLTEVVKYQPKEPDRLLEDEEILDFGQTRVQVLHTPGHTAGHLSFHFLDERRDFSGRFGSGEIRPLLWR